MHRVEIRACIQHSQSIPLALLHLNRLSIRPRLSIDHPKVHAVGGTTGLLAEDQLRAATGWEKVQLYCRASVEFRNRMKVPCSYLLLPMLMIGSPKVSLGAIGLLQLSI
jgi:hypothetical protein